MAQVAVGGRIPSFNPLGVMPDQKSSESPRHPSRVVRRRLRKAEVFVSPHTMRRAVGWVLEWLRLQTESSAAQVARQIEVVR